MSQEKSLVQRIATINQGDYSIIINENLIWHISIITIDGQWDEYLKCPAGHPCKP